MKKIIFLTFLVFFTSLYSSGQNTNSNTNKFDVHELLSKSSYLEDLNQLVDSIQTYHPQPYEFITKEAFENFIKNKKELITDSTTISEFAWLCSSLMAGVGCGHTNVSIENKLLLFSI